jgi:serine/threonine protein kinase
MGPEGPVVIDFGVARALDSPQATTTGTTMGTPSYLAPELLSGGLATGAADVFAWGVTMTFAASGRPAFGADSIPTVMNRILNAEPDLGPLTPPLRDLVADCLAKDPALRPTAEDLVSHLTGHPTTPVRRPATAAGTGSMRITGSGLETLTAKPTGAAVKDGVATGSPSGPGGPVRRGGEALPGATGGALPGAPGETLSRPRRRKRGPLVAAAAALLVVIGGTTAAIISAQSRGPGPGGPGGTLAASLPAALAPTALPSHGVVPPPSAPSRTPKPSASHAPQHVKTQPRPAHTTAKPATTATRKPSASAKPTATTSTAPSPSPSPTITPAPTPTLNPYTPAGVCGAGYKVIGSHGWGGKATTYLLFNATAGKDCVVTLGRYAKDARMGAVLRIKGGATGSDWGRFTYYAGPIRLATGGKCVIWGGGYAGGSWTSTWSHCP